MLDETNGGGTLPEEPAFDAPSAFEQERMVEAILFAAADPLTKPQIADRLPRGVDVTAVLAALEERYRDRGIVLRKVGLGYAFRTAPDLGFLMRREAEETRKLSRAAIETLAIVAYHQPATRAEIEEIRGVAVSRGTLDMLMDLGWVRLGKRRETPGRPATFCTTDGFLDHFGLSSAKDLPGLREIRDAGLLDSRPVPGSDVMPVAEADEAEDVEPDSEA